MDPSTFNHPVFISEKITIITCSGEVTSRAIRNYMLKNWVILSQGLDNSTILIMAGVHGDEEGQLGGDAGNMKEIQSQFSERVLKHQKAQWLLEEMEDRQIKIEYLDVLKFYKNNAEFELDEGALLQRIHNVNPKMVILIICYSQTLDFRFMLEESGIFAGIKINRDLCIQSKGQILTMSETQKKFLQTMAKPENIERTVWIEGQVGSGKTLLGIEVVKMKLAHYIRKFGYSAKQGTEKLRVFVAFEDRGRTNCKILEDKLKIELAEDIGKQSTLIVCRDLWQFQVNNQANYFTEFQRTIILMDECYPSMLIDAAKVDTRGPSYKKFASEYVICMGYDYLGTTTRDKHLVNESYMLCQLLEHQRSSQQILQLANFILRHKKPSSGGGSVPNPMIPTKESFSGPLPKWIEVEKTSDFLQYATSNMAELKNVMLIYNAKYPVPDPEVKEFCDKMKWEHGWKWEIMGSEASVIVILDLDQIQYEVLTRAKHELIIVTTKNTKGSGLSLALREIENGIHDDEQCKTYQKRHEMYYKIATSCSFKDNQEEIPKLLQKIMLLNAGCHSLEQNQHDFETMECTDYSNVMNLDFFAQHR